MQIHIPGNGEIQINHLVLDFNGTIALDGKLLQGVRERLFNLETAVLFVSFCQEALQLWATV